MWQQTLPKDDKFLQNNAVLQPRNRIRHKTNFIDVSASLEQQLR
jgi:hypothetical protein